MPLSGHCPTLAKRLKRVESGIRTKFLGEVSNCSADAGAAVRKF
jgi:hypothetical protein